VRLFEAKEYRAAVIATMTFWKQSYAIASGAGGSEWSQPKEGHLKKCDACTAVSASIPSDRNADDRRNQIAAY
jgi:hypothetical protein